MMHLRHLQRSAVALLVVLMGFALLLPAVLAALSAAGAAGRWAARLEAEGTFCQPQLWVGPAAKAQLERTAGVGPNGAALVVFSLRIDSGPGAGLTRVGLVGPESN